MRTTTKLYYDLTEDERQAAEILTRRPDLLALMYKYRDAGPQEQAEIMAMVNALTRAHNGARS